MLFEYKLPDLGEGVNEGEIVRWLINVGDVVKPEQPLVEVLTDKVQVEMPAPVGGRIASLGGEQGDILPVGAVLLTIDTEAKEVAAPAPTPAAVAEEGGSPSEQVAAAAGDEAPTAPAAAAPGDGPALAVPAVRRLARELGVDLAAVAGSGPGGRVLEDDVRAAQGGARAPSRPAPAAPEGDPLAEGPRRGAARRIPLRGLRRVIAQHLLDSHRNTAPYTFVEEADFTELVGLRERIQPLAQKAGVRLTYLPFLIAALCMALREHPLVNATVDVETGDLVVHEEHHIGLAVHTDEGLVVPVIRNADQRNLLDLAREIERLSNGAREGKLTREDMVGGTISVTSLGILGGVMGTPMLNTPQIAVLGVHRIAPRPVVRNGEIVARQTANISLTLDHRYIDGYVGASFAKTLVGYLEDPALMLFWLAELRGYVPGPE